MIPPGRILITGATGGLGIALVAAARAQGYDVRATGRSDAMSDRIKALGAEFVRADLTDDAVFPDLCSGCQAVIHAAALSASWGACAEFRAINVTATQRLLAAAARADCKTFVFISSPSIFASFVDRTNMSGNAKPRVPALNHYARTKLEAERIVLAANSSAMACCAIRPRAIVGPDDKVLLPKLAAMARRRFMPLPRGGQALIELTDVRDAASATMLAVSRARSIAGQAINISGGKPVDVKQVAHRLASALGQQPRFVTLPFALARAIAHIFEASARLIDRKTEPPLTRYTLATLAFSQTFDQSDARRLLGYSAQHDGLATLLTEAQKLRRRS